MCVKGFTDKPYAITFQYIKSTDSPVSIGSDTDYSTTEKIVGTWIDGKPVYQRTYVFESAISIANTWTVLSPISAVGIERIINACAYNASGYFNLECIVDNGDIKAEATREDGAVLTYAVTLRYTKTTD